MKNLGLVLETFSARSKESSLPRPKVENLNLIENYGIEFDKFAGKKLDQTVMIVGLKSYEIAKDYGVDLAYGSLGENILLDFNPHDFEVSTKFQIGEAIIEITQVCTVCSHLNVFDENLPNLLRNQRGVYCKIIKSGKITKGMQVKEIVC